MTNSGSSSKASAEPKRIAAAEAARFAYRRSVYQDLQETLYAKYSRPSAIALVNASGDLEPCLPRLRRPVPREFFHRVTEAWTKERPQANLANYDLEFAAKVRRDKRWGWRRSSLGTLDLVLPCYIKTPSGRQLDAILILGKYRSRVFRKKHLRAELISLGLSARSIRSLKPLIEEIPPPPDDMKQVAGEVSLLLNGFSVPLSRSFDERMLFGRERLVDEIELPNVDRVDLSEVWLSLEAIVRPVSRAVSAVSSLVVLHCKGIDATEFEVVGTVNAPVARGHIVRFSAAQDFDYLESRVTGAKLPSLRARRLSWLQTKRLVGAGTALAFAARCADGNLLVVFFGLKEPMSYIDHAILYDAWATRLEPFLHRAFDTLSLDELMSDTGHMLGRALAGVRNGRDEIVELRRRGNPTEARIRQARWTIENGIERLRLIRHNFYAFADRRRRTSAWEKELKPIGAESAILERFQYFEKMVREEGMRLNREGRIPRHVRFLGGRKSLQLVLLNLFDNAIKFSYNDTFMTFRLGYCETVEKGIRFELENLGWGVPLEEQVRVFEPRVKASVRNQKVRSAGLGLGLSYCRNVVEELFNGDVSLRSKPAHKSGPRDEEYDNWLTTVVVELPEYK